MASPPTYRTIDGGERVLPSENEIMTDGNAIVVGRIEELQGYCFGFRQRCALAAIEMDSTADYAALEGRLKAIAELAPLFEPVAPEASDEGSPPDVRALMLLGRLARNLQEAAEFFAHDDPKVVRRVASAPGAGASPTKVLLALPGHSLEAARRCFGLFVDLANSLLADSSATGLTDAQRQELDALSAQLKQTVEKQPYVYKYLPGALTLGIPFQFITSEVVQFGWGSRSRLQFATSTDRTPFVSARIARSKIASTALMRSCGLPVPQNMPVSNEDDAARAAGELGFPVVVKPADLDGGKGAAADLRNEDDVRRAYRDANAISSNIMVEEHVEGREFRLMVMNGKLFWAFERVPARVFGDGVSTVRELIEQVNLTRVDNPATLGIPQIIEIDDDLEEVLRRRSQSLDTIPPAGEAVRLRNSPLSVTGGEMIAALDTVHPDNAELAVRAARLLRLDIAGVDFLTPDVGQSWLENGGRITEVNAGPQVGSTTRPDMFPAFLRELTGGDCRIPVALVIGGQTGPVEEELRGKTQNRAARIGIATADRITIGGSTVLEGPANPSLVARQLTTDPGVDAIVWFTDGRSVATNGLPFDRIDLLVLANVQAQGMNPMQFLPIIKDNVGEILLEGSQTQASSLAQALGVKVVHANTGAQIMRRLQAILPKDPA